MFNIGKETINKLNITYINIKHIRVKYYAAIHMQSTHSSIRVYNPIYMFFSNWNDITFSLCEVLNKTSFYFSFYKIVKIICTIQQRAYGFTWKSTGRRCRRVAARLVEAIKKKANSSFIFTRCHHLVDPSLYTYIHPYIYCIIYKNTYRYAHNMRDASSTNRYPTAFQFQYTQKSKKVWPLQLRLRCWLLSDTTRGVYDDNIHIKYIKAISTRFFLPPSSHCLSLSSLLMLLLLSLKMLWAKLDCASFRRLCGFSHIFQCYITYIHTTYIFVYAHT